LPISAVDAISPSFQHTKQQLLQPFRAGQWARLALVGLLAGELGSGGGCNFNFNVPQSTNGSQRFLDAGLSAANPTVYAGLIALLIVLGITLWIVLLYASSVMRFVLFDSIIAKECRIRQYWVRRQGPGLRFFLWQLLLLLATIVGITILIGIPAAIALALGWLKEPGKHMAPLILGGIFLFFVFLVFVVCILVVSVLTKDFVVPQMALEDISAIEGWRRLLRMLKPEKGSYAGYLGMKIVMALGAAMVIGIVSTIAIIIVAIPLGGFSVIAVLTGKTAGLTWNVYTITLAVIVGCFLLAIIFYVVALIAVPAMVFFPAYSIHFLASRYPALDALLHPPPVSPAAPEPPASPPPLPPEPSPIG
jgi:hypothetical protein